MNASKNFSWIKLNIYLSLILIIYLLNILLFEIKSTYAVVAESVDAQRWGRCGVKPVEVQVFSAAPYLSVTHWYVSTFGDAD